MRRRTEITIETDRVVLVSRTRYAAPGGVCGVCGEGARVMALNEAAARLRVPPPTMTSIAEAAGLHLTQMRVVPSVVCVR